MARAEKKTSGPTNILYPLTGFQTDMVDDLARHHGVTAQDVIRDIADDLSPRLNDELNTRLRQAAGTEIKPGKYRTGSIADITLRTLQRVPDVDNKLAALERLIEVASHDTGQSKKVADFLLAWWNADNCGAFDLTTLWQVDTKIAEDMIAVCALIALTNSYPDSLGYKKVFEGLVKDWRNFENSDN